MSLLVLPPWILLEFPHSHSPITTITVTFIPASRKPTHKAFTSSEQMATSPCHPPVSVSVPSQGGASSGLGALGAGPEDPPPGCHWPDLPWLQNAQLCVHPGPGEKKRWSQEIPDLSSSRIPLGKADEPATPDPTSPVGESERRADARSLLPQTASLPLLPSRPGL